MTKKEKPPIEIPEGMVAQMENSNVFIILGLDKKGNAYQAYFDDPKLSQSKLTMNLVFLQGLIATMTPQIYIRWHEARKASEKEMKTDNDKTKH